MWQHLIDYVKNTQIILFMTEMITMSVIFKCKHKTILYWDRIKILANILKQRQSNSLKKKNHISCFFISFSRSFVVLHWDLRLEFTVTHTKKKIESFLLCFRDRTKWILVSYFRRFFVSLCPWESAFGNDKKKKKKTLKTIWMDTQQANKMLCFCQQNVHQIISSERKEKCCFEKENFFFF